MSLICLLFFMCITTFPSILAKRKEGNFICLVLWFLNRRRVVLLTAPLFVHCGVFVCFEKIKQIYDGVCRFYGIRRGTSEKQQEEALIERR